MSVRRGSVKQRRRRRSKAKSRKHLVRMHRPRKAPTMKRQRTRTRRMAQRRKTTRRPRRQRFSKHPLKGGTDVYKTCDYPWKAIVDYTNSLRQYGDNMTTSMIWVSRNQKRAEMYLGRNLLTFTLKYSDRPPQLYDLMNDPLHGDGWNTGNHKDIDGIITTGVSKQLGIELEKGVTNIKYIFDNILTVYNAGPGRNYSSDRRGGFPFWVFMLRIVSGKHMTVEEQAVVLSHMRGTLEHYSHIEEWTPVERDYVAFAKDATILKGERMATTLQKYIEDARGNQGETGQRLSIYQMDRIALLCLKLVTTMPSHFQERREIDSYLGWEVSERTQTIFEEKNPAGEEFSSMGEMAFFDILSVGEYYTDPDVINNPSLVSLPATEQPPPLSPAAKAAVAKAKAAAERAAESAAGMADYESRLRIQDAALAAAKAGPGGGGSAAPGGGGGGSAAASSAAPDAEDRCCIQ
jgi:hypothetical protein